MSEYHLKDKLRLLLERNGWLVVFIMQTNKNGWPDVQAFKNGRCIFIETKLSEKTERPLQTYRHDQLRKQGFEVYVITDKKEFGCIRNI